MAASAALRNRPVTKCDDGIVGERRGSSLVDCVFWKLDVWEMVNNYRVLFAQIIRDQIGDCGRSGGCRGLEETEGTMKSKNDREVEMRMAVNREPGTLVRCASVLGFRQCGKRGAAAQLPRQA